MYNLLPQDINLLDERTASCLVIAIDFTDLHQFAEQYHGDVEVVLAKHVPLELQ